MFAISFIYKQYEYFKDKFGHKGHFVDHKITNIMYIGPIMSLQDQFGLIGVIGLSVLSFKKIYI